MTAMSSSREKIRRTGRPAAMARSAAWAPGAEGASSLPPKPPPVTVWTTRTRLRAEPSGRGHRLLHVEGALHGAVDDDAARPVGQGDHAVRLDVGVLLVGRVVGPLDDHDAAAHHGDRGLAPPDLPVGHHLARGQRLLHVEHGRQRLVVHHDRGQALPERLGGLGRHEGHRFAHVPHVLAGQDRPVGLDHRDEVLAGQVAGREHGAHAGDGAGLVGVEVGRCGRGRAASAARPPTSDAGEGQVVDVEGGPLDLVGSVGPPHPLADAHLRVSGGLAFIALRVAKHERGGSHIQARSRRGRQRGPMRNGSECATIPRPRWRATALADEAQAERRKAYRMGMALPVRVTGFTDEGAAWEEVSSTEDVSQSGLSFRLHRQVELGQLLALSLPMPKRLREFDLNEETYRVYGLVRGIVHKDDRERVGVMFFGKYPPRGFRERPAARYLLPSDSVAGMPVPPELRSPPPPSLRRCRTADADATASVPPASGRSPCSIPCRPPSTTAGPRADQPVRELHAPAGGRVGRRAPGRADGGRQPQPGRRPRHDLAGIRQERRDPPRGIRRRLRDPAEVRGVKRGRDGIIRLHLRFLDGQTPDRLLGIKG